MKNKEKLHLLVLVEDGFNDVELTSVLSCLSKSEKWTFTYFHNTKTNIKSQYGTYALQATTHVDLNAYDAIFIPGGPAAQLLRSNEQAQTIIKDFWTKNKPIYAICDAPNVLFEKGLVAKNASYSSFPIQSGNDNLNYPGTNRNANMVTNYENKLITGRCAAAGIDLGLEIVKTTCDIDTYNLVHFYMYAK
ncbi:putative intracellular protease/amidase (putative glutaminase) [Metamycoplasma cloacale]|uniref:DJ-1 family protein n=1 Tax=Metamycoplasma cloacale TaxID=92401 RepID=A0A2Z4LLR7_9BACT|nr:DJ-1/PfpI family protein [Metamycoplasma cloacale]AWX42666.1 DJ-1 family protein [Metamycoplasma cloacale]VEU79522.1 putative intracellular protease/amidase (putative glutaminase) [Metamycoplasma cloacale]